MPSVFDNEITSAKNILQEEFSNELLNIIPSRSTMLSMCTRLPNFKSSVTRLPVTSGLVSVGVVAEGGKKPVTKASFDNEYMHRIEMAGISLFTDSQILDAMAGGLSLIDFVQNQFREVAMREIEKTILFDTTLPNTFSVYQSATRAGNILESTPNALYDDIFAEDGIQAMIDNDGYNPNGFVAGTTMRAKLRALKDGGGRPLYYNSIRGDSDVTRPDTLLNLPLMIQPPSFWDGNKADLIVGDWSKLYYAMGQDFTFTKSSEATIEHNGEMINLFQHDMTALRFHFSIAFFVPSLINYDNYGKVKTSLSPFAILKKPA